MHQRKFRPKTEVLRLQRKRRSLEEEGVIAAQRVFGKVIEKADPEPSAPGQHER